MVTEKDFGVFRLWQELVSKYPSFSFQHGFGLGVLAPGRKVKGTMQRLFEAQDNAPLHQMICNTYERLGKLIALEIHNTPSAFMEDHPT
jgi:hypothetical protein